MAFGDRRPSAGSEIAKGATIKQLHQELAPEVTYASFRRRLLSSVPQPIQATVRLEHEPGEQAQIDYCDGIAVVDGATGESKKTHLFCGVLPFSSHACGELAWSQKLPSCIGSHERMWAFFGGVTSYVVIDNLEASAKSAHRYDPDVNPTYCEYGNTRASPCCRSSCTMKAAIRAPLAVTHESVGGSRTAAVSRREAVRAGATTSGWTLACWSPR